MATSCRKSATKFMVLTISCEITVTPYEFAIKFMSSSISPRSAMARLVVPDLLHHVTQRGNRRMAVFASDEDYALTLDLLAERCRKARVEVWSYCLMLNHVHLILTASTPLGLGAALGETHRRYSGVINARLRVTGHLFQACCGSVTMDEAHLMVAARTMAPIRTLLIALMSPFADIKRGMSAFAARARCGVDER